MGISRWTYPWICEVQSSKIYSISWIPMHRNPISESHLAKYKTSKISTDLFVSFSDCGSSEILGFKWISFWVFITIYIFSTLEVAFGTSSESFHHTMKINDIQTRSDQVPFTQLSLRSSLSSQWQLLPLRSSRHQPWQATAKQRDSGVPTESNSTHS